jgi:hypothetical protein
MAKGREKPGKEKKKPKAAGNKAKAPSAYKQGYGGSAPSPLSITTPKKS